MIILSNISAILFSKKISLKRSLEMHSLRSTQSSRDYDMKGNPKHISQF